MFLLVVVVAVLAGSISPWILAIYIFASLITFVVYAIDKSAAGTERRRVPESSLHLLALIGGWPGALLAQQQLRHKTRKQPFRLILWLMILVNFALFAWLFTPLVHEFSWQSGIRGLAL